MESIATGVVAGMMDAGVQGIEIATHMQKDFSFSEMITTSMTAGFATNSAEVTDVLKAAAEANVASQLGSMAIGASDKFDFRQLIDTVASAGISAKINLKLKDFFSKTTLTSFPGQLGQNTVNAVAGAGVNEIVYHQPPNVESLAAQSLGTTIATEAGNAAGEWIDQERIKLGIPNEAETMAAKKAEEEKAVWRNDNQQQQQSQQQAQQQSSTARTLRMMELKQRVAEVSLSIGELNIGDSKTISDDLYADWRSNATAEAKPVSNANSNKQPFLSNPTSTGDSNGKWQQIANSTNSIPARAIPNDKPIEPVYPEFLAIGAFDLFKIAQVGVEALVEGGAAALGRDLDRLGQAWSRGIDAPGRSATSRKIGLFADKEISESVVNEGVNNNINLLRLQRQLNIGQANSIFTEGGGLTQEAINSSRLIKPGEELGNQSLQNELANTGGNLADWGKYATRPINSPSGDFEMHFYHNPVTGDVYYGRDYKAIFQHQGQWNLEPKPNFEYQPSRYNL